MLAPHPKRSGLPLVTVETTVPLSSLGALSQSLEGPDTSPLLLVKLRPKVLPSPAINWEVVEPEAKRVVCPQNLLFCMNLDNLRVAWSLPGAPQALAQCGIGCRERGLRLRAQLPLWRGSRVTAGGPAGGWAGGGTGRPGVPPAPGLHAPSLNEWFWGSWVVQGWSGSPTLPSGPGFPDLLLTHPIPVPPGLQHGCSTSNITPTSRQEDGEGPRGRRQMPAEAAPL